MTGELWGVPAGDSAWPEAAAPLDRAKWGERWTAGSLFSSAAMQPPSHTGSTAPGTVGGGRSLSTLSGPPLASLRPESGGVYDEKMSITREIWRIDGGYVANVALAVCVTSNQESRPVRYGL